VLDRSPDGMTRIAYDDIQPIRNRLYDGIVSFRYYWISCGYKEN
jgi:hypothetical protein